jgi:A/G-specific adenine glycosylase
VQGWGTVPPYYTFVSEVMLQSTRVAAVVPVFRSFVALYPDIETLAVASDADVTQAVYSLGNSATRGPRLRSAAAMMISDFNGEVPATSEGLLQLPGVGDYTARAILSIGFGQAITLPPREVNVRRVFSRLLGIPTTLPAWQRNAAIQDHLTTTMPLDRPGDFNQAIMELGQAVCRIEEPLCATCPLRPFCIYGGQVE